MKRNINMLVVIVASLIILSSCGGKSTGEIVEEYNGMLQEVATVSKIEAAEKYLYKNLRSLDEEQTGMMLLALEEYISVYDESLFDYEEVIEKYGNNISPALKELLEMKLKEEQVPIVVESSLQISRAELLQRLFSMELFMEKNIDDKVIKDDALWLYSKYLNLLLSGTGNSPVFDHNTNKFSPTVTEEYETFVKEHPKANVSWVLEEYEGYLKEIGYTLNYEDKEASAKFFEVCNNISLEAGKRIYDVKEKSGKK